ncbi:hypothetical protein THIOM_001337 [Candidatus Thiomargarita nelsonii]|uniref:Transposase (putative) YhgA-like domain-containing protein n=1 Tax=Candidatus Thiomargarita nelsonii TaxID=1003181 RepID=A0A0A6RJQ8_9GAMM|nr:hypothetical protein THIOM_001337 [Candidatus Thiomargarita nelsonii]
MLKKAPKKKKPTKKNKNTRLGTDEAFWQLMKVSGSSVLKLFGVPSTQAEKYHFHAVALKDKLLKPDVEGFPVLECEDGRFFLEFQGYNDPFIRHRLLAEVFLACATEQYQGWVMAGIVYTDKKYKSIALPLNTFKGVKDCRVGGCFQELVLTDYTVQKLLDIDPKLIVLAPFTLATTTKKESVLSKGREWGDEVTQVFPPNQQQSALNVLGLFVLNRFRKISYEEVIAMLNFDLMDTLAGKQVYEMGEINDAREMVVEVLDERFGVVPFDLIEQVRAVNHRDVLKRLHRQAIQCQDMESFKENLSKTLH